MDKKEAARLEFQILEGLRELAFSDSTDVVRLLGPLPESAAELKAFAESLNLYNVSELKIPKPGQLDVKYYDRFEALRLLRELAGAGAGGDETGFYAALQAASQALESHRGGAPDDA